MFRADGKTPTSCNILAWEKALRHENQCMPAVARAFLGHSTGCQRVCLDFWHSTLGARQPKLGKPIGAVASRIYAVSWKRQQIDLTRLAKLRWVDKIQIDVLAHLFGVSRTYLVKQLGTIRANPDLVKCRHARRLIKLKERRFTGENTKVVFANSHNSNV